MSSITKVSYHILGPLVFGIGLILVVKMPASGELVGASFFGLPPDGNQIILRMGAGLMQIAGILLFLKWFGEHGREKHVRLYKKYEPMILLFLVILTPILLNATISSTAKAYVYAGKSGSEAVEYLPTDHPCTVNPKQKAIHCVITLKNYNHSSQKVTVQLNWKTLDRTSLMPVSLIQRQEKKTAIEIPLSDSELRKLASAPEETQPEILIQ